MKRYVTLLFVALVAVRVLPAWAQSDAGPQATKLPQWAPKLKVTVKPAVIRVGDPITVTIQATANPDVSVNLPLKLALDPFEERARQEPKTETGAGEKKHAATQKSRDATFIITVTVYQLGELNLPPIELTALHTSGALVTVKTDPIPIRVRSAMANEPNPQIKGATAPVAVYEKNPWPIYIGITLLLVLIAVVATLLISRRLRNRQKPAPIVPREPAHERALRRLRQINTTEYAQNEQYKTLYLLLSEILREYIEGRYDVSALEMTTAEIVQGFKRAQVPSAFVVQFAHYFEQCDLVKFAKYAPTNDQAEQAVAQAILLVEQTMPVVINAPA